MTRQLAMQWWNNLASARKTQICDTHTELVGSVRRWETLTGREIEMLWVSETQGASSLIDVLPKFGTNEFNNMCSQIFGGGNKNK